MQDFASASLVTLIRAWLDRTAPGAAGASRVDALREGRVPPETKRDLLARVVRVSGPFAPAEVGGMLDHIAYHPIWAAALRSATPGVLFDKWGRFERFGHSTNRLEITRPREGVALCRRTAVDGSAPTDTESLFICGLIVALVEGIGCHGVTCHMRRVDGGEWCLRKGGRFAFPASLAGLDTAHWRLSWQKGEPGPPDNLGRACLPVLAQAPAEAGTLRRVAALLARDPGQRWSLGDLASETALSVRTLQRRLGGAGFPVSRLTRLIRVEEACRLLSSGDLSVTAVAFCAGYSDSAHLSRDFRAVMGMSPSTYRNLQAAAPPKN
ncbi:transcriptional regulator, AraC family protein [Pseudooceanicola batsensis HTCC2597]|uniref:Transcriptional regulator, AraC family protein n=1 Tax=Pseudooceanicola batsensis (strain ATCC BAA-863 / DSM 15984 / KCTC 12145 / HTCC2597) TaxID=252305 RepID=A3TSR5_PSEBH|nr:AraC family transcriptional regulator [Pseudooceanicola batsensis]EAQ04692.1 transcriptional regulator, AraC family protein [Pseudooceanicola batsensis HTCC2597]